MDAEGDKEREGEVDALGDIEGEADALGPPGKRPTIEIAQSRVLPELLDVPVTSCSALVSYSSRSSRIDLSSGKLV